MDNTISILLFVLGTLILVAGIGLLMVSLLGLLNKDKAAARRRKLDKEICIYGDTTIGTRKYQQDSSTMSPKDDPYFIKHNGLFAAVCDGMGGMQGGERASALCAETLYKSVINRGSVIDDPCAVMKDAVIRADRSIYALTDENGQRMRAGTTAVAAVISGGRLHWISVGDSRIYMFENGVITKVTRDHNYMLELMTQVEQGAITLYDAENHPQAEALISYVGMGGIKLIDEGSVPFSEGRLCILCSDGLYKVLTDLEIETIVKDNQNNLRALPRKLVEAVEARRGVRSLDNTTVVVIGYGY
ncbi:MAG: serine/threonine-protein phosphatase [Clostridia bacterium]|nr:serine/threonine-protein phosphatase [Clostridia bacterium]